MSGLSKTTEYYNQQIKEAESRIKSGESPKRIYTCSRKNIWDNTTRRPRKTRPENIAPEKPDLSTLY